MKEMYGYKRPDGKIGIRNHLLIISSVVCANHVVTSIAARIPGAVYAVHEHGCGHSNHRDLQQVLRTLIGFGQNPNVGGCVVVGLGCEDTPCETVAEGIAKTGKPVVCINIQKEKGIRNSVRKGVEEGLKIKTMIDSLEKSPMHIEDLIVGLECGGSDATSGIAANPAIGRASDLVIAAGGTSILSETTEHVGAEHILARRAANEKVREDFMNMMNRLFTRAEWEDIDLTNLAPGNIEGGLSTPEEKSLGCVLKGGTALVTEILDYAQAPAEKGLTIMDTPGFDVESVTGMVAAGAQVVLFSTGLGTPTGCPIAPVIKITGNSRTYEDMSDCIDINAGEIIDGTSSIEEMGQIIFDEIIEVCNGRQPLAEENGFMDFSITRCGFSY